MNTSLISTYELVCSDLPIDNALDQMVSISLDVDFPNIETSA